MKAKQKHPLFRAVWLALALLALVLCLCGCSSGGMAGDGAEYPGGGSDSSTIVADGVGRKIVYTVNMDIETGDVASVRESVLASGRAAGGYVEQQNDYGGADLSHSYIVFRVPTDKLEEFVGGAEGLGKVVSKRVSSTDITTEYVNSSARKAAYEERKAQLEAILEEDGLTAADRIAVIDSISEVNAALQEIELQLTQYDSLVEYSTVRLDIYRATNVWEIVGTVALVLLFVGLAAGVVVLGVKYGRERNKNRPAGGGGQ